MFDSLNIEAQNAIFNTFSFLVFASTKSVFIDDEKYTWVSAEGP